MTTEYCNSRAWKTSLVRITDVDDFAGRTIAAVGGTYSGTIALRFTDGTWFYGVALPDGLGDGAYLDKSNERPDVHEALELGLIDQAEFDRVWTEERAKEEARQLREYERLKARFEGGATGEQPGESASRVD